MSPRLDIGRAAMALCMLLAMGAARAGSFLYSEDEWYYRGSLGYTSATQAWTPGAHLRNIGCESDRTTLSNDVEYGWSYYHTLFAMLDVGQAKCGAQSKTGTGDLNLGIRGRLNPFLNFRAWELGVTVPTVRRPTTPQPELGCGVFGAFGNVARSDDLSPLLSASYGAGVRIWQGPLAHQLNANGALSGPFGVTSDWSWLAGLNYQMPLANRPPNLALSVNDCGTQARQLRSGVQISYRYTREATVGCGFDAAMWGEDVTRSSGPSCYFSYWWH